MNYERIIKMNYNTPDQITEFIDIENYKKQINNYWVSKPSKKMPSPQEEWIEVITEENKLFLERESIDKGDTKALERWKSLYAKNNGKSQTAGNTEKSRKYSKYKEFLRHDKNIIHLPRQHLPKHYGRKRYDIFS